MQHISTVEEFGKESTAIEIRDNKNCEYYSWGFTLLSLTAIQSSDIKNMGGDREKHYCGLHGKGMGSKTGDQLPVLGAAIEVAAPAGDDPAASVPVLLPSSQVALSLTQVGVWEWDLQTQHITWDATTAALLGLDVDQPQRSDQVWQQYLHPRDRDRVIQEVQQALIAQTPYEVEFRILHPDRKVHWLWVRGAGLYQAGQPVRSVGVVMDVTARKRPEVTGQLAEAAWQENQQLLDAIMTRIPGGVFRCLYRADGSVQFVYASQSYCDLFRLRSAVPQPLTPEDQPSSFQPSPFQPSSFQPQCVLDCLDSAERQIWQQIIQQAQQTLSPGYMEYRVALPAGGEKWFARWVRFGRDAAGSLIVDGIDIDITDRKQAEQALQSAETQLQTILQGTAAATGEAFFPVLVKNLASVLGVRHAYVAELTDRQLQTIAFWSDQQLCPNVAFEWDRFDCCRFTLTQGSHYCIDCLQQQFPHPELLAQLNASSYLGVAMQDRSGNPMGTLCILDDRPLDNRALAEVILRIFAARAAAELERQQATIALQQLNQDLEMRVEQRTQELKASLQEKEVLLREVHHRVKNNLQMIQSLLNLQRRSIQDPQVLSVLTDSQNRVKAMALVHEKLYQTDRLSQINFQDYLRSLMRDLLKSYGLNPATTTLSIQVADLELALDMAIACGLIINELFSNAIKYAFPDGRTGQILIQFNADRPDCYELVVADDGVGIPEAINLSTSRSLGLRLVNALTRQLRGTLKLERDDGTQFTITFAKPSEL